MRVLLFSDFFCEDTTTFIYNEVIGLKNRGHEVLYICTERINEKKFPFQNVFVVPYTISPFLRKLRWHMEINDIDLSFKSRHFSKKITKIIEDFKPDIIHCNFGYQALKLLDNFNYNSIPVVITFHGYDATFKFNRKSYVNSLKRHIINPNVFSFLVTNAFKKNFDLNHIPLERMRIVHCGINTKDFKRTFYDTKRDPFIFLQVASFHEKKGHEYTVKAFRKLLDEHPDFNCKLVFGGEGVNLDKIKNLVKELGLTGKTEFKGLVTPLQAKQLMEEAHCFVHHSITSDTGDTEGITTAIMEALAMELPVLSTFHGGIPEMVTDGVQGFLVNEKDVDSYAQRMWEIKDWGYMKESRHYIKEKFDIDIHIRNLETEFGKIIRKKGPN